MQRYIVLGIVLNFAVNFMLILAASRLTGFECSALRGFAGASVGALYASACTVPRLWFLQSRYWYVISLIMVSLAAFGIERSTLRRSVVFFLLRFALDALADGTDTYFDLIWAGALSVVCLFGFRGGMWQRYVPVALRYGQQAVSLTAMHDTGNTLSDPVTGQPVLVVGADVAQRLTGLSKQQLSQPVETMGAFPGLRLIPYRTVGKSGDFLLALKIKNAKIGERKTDALVAFAPEELDGTGRYQALIGGMV